MNENSPHGRLELEYDYTDMAWSGQLLEEIIFFVEDEHEIRPPQEPRIKVTVEILEEDGNG